MDETSLLDLPDELLKLIVAGSTGQGVAALSCCCKRLKAVAAQLQRSPIMCSAMSTDHDLHAAIKEATHRAMAGSWGAVDFALIFVAHYGLPKKYTDPGDASHAVDMLREVLGKDIPIVGCACTGIMGVGPDSTPLEIDPAMPVNRKRRGEAALARGVTVLLGKVPPGCAVRAFAAEEGATAAWPAFEEALSLTSSQRTQLATELAAAATAATTTATPAAAAAHSNAPGRDDGSASPATAAAATSLLAVAGSKVTADAAAGSSAAAAAAGALYHSEYGDVSAELEPQLCLLLHRSEVYEEELTNTLDYFKAQHPCMRVVGGASSGAGDLLFSAGAASRLASDPPDSPAFVGLLLCSASGQTAAAASSKAPAAAGDAAAAASPLSSTRSSKSLLPVASFSVYGLAPTPGCCVLTDVSASVAGHDSDFLGTRLINVAAATAVPGTAKLLGAGSSSSGDVSVGSTEAPGTSSSPDESLPVRRSQRVQQQQQQQLAADASAAAQGSSGLQHLSRLGRLMEEEELLDKDAFVALWRCASGDVPGPFTGTENEVVLFELVEIHDVDPEAGSPTVQVEVISGLSSGIGTLQGPDAEDPLAGLQQHSIWQQQPGSKLCMQLVVNCAEGSRSAISRGLARVQQELAPPASARDAAAAACDFMAGCYAAAAANAKAVGARSGLLGHAVFSCTGRGQALYKEGKSDDDYKTLDASKAHVDGEAALLDAAMQQGCPFVGVYCDGELGPLVQHGCLGWGEEGSSSVVASFTSMFAAFGFRSA